MKVTLQNAVGVRKEVKIGFSWTTLFFGFLPALFRGDLKWGIIMFVVALVLGSFTVGSGGLLTSIIFAFIYNKLYIRELLEKGYYPSTESAGFVLRNAGVLA